MARADLTVRAVVDAGEFAVAPGDDPGYADTIAALWADGDGRPEWTFVDRVGGDPVARVAYLVTDSVTDPAWLGTLPPKELGVTGLAAWADDPVGTLAALVRSTAGTPGPGLTLEVRANAELHPDVDTRRRVAARLGLDLFQEKEGVVWTDDGSPIVVPDRLSMRTLDDVGHDRFRQVMSRPGVGTLDRNDAWYYQHTGADNWASQMLAFCGEDDREMWLIGELDDDPVGYVGVVPFDDGGTATIAHIGVVPEHRGRGYVDDLLVAGTAAARRSGFTRILSDVDVLNTPMLAAMERAGHRAAATPWHVWTYRGVVDTG